MKTFRKGITIILIFSIMATILSGCSLFEIPVIYEELLEKPGVSELPTQNPISAYGQSLIYDPNLSVNNSKSETIEFWFPTDVQWICEEYVGEYQNIHQNITIKTKALDWNEYWVELDKSLLAGNGPDLYWMNSAFNNRLIKYAKPLSEENFPKEVMEEEFRNYNSHVIDGNIYCVDLAYTSMVVMYNKEMWRDAGLTEADIPKDWIEFREIAEKLTIHNSEGYIDVEGFDFNGDNNFVNLVTALNYQCGQLQYTDDNKHTNFNTNITIENMEYFMSFMLDWLSAPSDIENRKIFCIEMAAMICDNPWVYIFLKDMNPDLEIGVFPMPVCEGAPAVQMIQSDVSPCISWDSSKEKQEVCEDFLKFLLARDDFIKDYSLGNCLFPSKYCLADDKDILGNDVLLAISKTIDKSILTVPASPEVENCKVEYLQNSFLDFSLTASQAAALTDIECDEALEEVNFDSLEQYYKYILLFEKFDIS